MIMLEKRFGKAQTLMDIQKIKCHSCPKEQVQTSVFRSNTYNTIHIVHFQDEKYQVQNNRQFVTCEYDRNWWFACVTSE